MTRLDDDGIDTFFYCINGLQYALHVHQEKTDHILYTI